MDLAGNEDLWDKRRRGRWVVGASRDGLAASLEFVSGGNEANVEGQVRRLQQRASETPAENEISLRLLWSYASSVQHQQYHDTDIITV